MLNVIALWGNANLEPQWDTTTHPQIGCKNDNIKCGQELQSSAAEGASWYDCWVKLLGGVWWRTNTFCDHAIPPWDRCLTEMYASGTQRNIPRMSERHPNVHQLTTREIKHGAFIWWNTIQEYSEKWWLSTRINFMLVILGKRNRHGREHTIRFCLCQVQRWAKLIYKWKQQLREREEKTRRLEGGHWGPGASKVLMMFRTEALNSGTVIVLSWTLLCCRVCYSFPGLPRLGTVSKHPLLSLWQSECLPSMPVAPGNGGQNSQVEDLCFTAGPGGLGGVSSLWKRKKLYT